MPAARLLATTFSVLLLSAAPAFAGDPIMPLSDVHSGMRCTGYSVVRGTDIASFDVDIDDVIDGDASGEGPRLLVRVSGPAVDATGIGPGFSGSPIYCRGRDGVERNAGAISESVGEYGGHEALATPIQAVLGVPLDVPRHQGRSRAARTRERAVAARARPLATPLTVSGLSPALGSALSAAARRHGRTVLAAPAGPLGSFPPQPMRPGAAVGVSYSSGDIQVGAIGTVAYTDGDAVWAFGHPFNDAGARRLFLQDAYVYKVISNPVGIPDTANTYKLASLGHTLGIVTDDADDAIAGRTGVLPDTIPVRIYANDLDTGAHQVTGIRVADERAVGLPEGGSPAAFVAPLAVTDAASSLLSSAPGRLTGDVCVQITFAALRRPTRFCNRYVSSGPADPDFSGTADTVAARASSDVFEALSDIDAYQGRPPEVSEIAVRMDLARGEQRAFLRSVRLPHRVRAGHRVRVRATLRRVRGGTIHRSYRVRIPGWLGHGRHVLRFTGADADTADDSLLGAIVIDSGGSTSGDPGPASIKALARRITRIGRYDGVHLHAAGARMRGFRDPRLRISGSAAATVRVQRSKR